MMLKYAYCRAGACSPRKSAPVNWHGGSKPNATKLTKLVIPRPVFKLVVGISGVSIAGDCHTSDIGHWFAMTLT